MRDVKRLNVGSGLEGSTQLSYSFPCSNQGVQKLPGAQLFRTHSFSTLQFCIPAHCRMFSAHKTGSAGKPRGAGGARKIGMDPGRLHSGQP